jgi:phage antirepressor YoqD-like protein
MSTKSVSQEVRDAITHELNIARCHSNRVVGNGELCISDAAKTMQIQPRKLFAWMEQHQWIFRRGNKWVAYQDRIQSGYLTHRVTLVERKDGTDKEVAQVLVTAKGQAKLAEVAA